MHLVLAAAAFFVGLVSGSFLYNYALRYPDKSVWRGRSVCPHCGRELAALDLVPVFSYLGLRGRCRYCGKRFSWRYPVAELATGVLFALTYLWLAPIQGFWGALGLAVYAYLAVAALIVVVVDLRLGLIPDRVIVPAGVVALSWLVLDALRDALSLRGLLVHLLCGLAAGGFFLGLVTASKGRWMGGGDVKLFALIGLIVGWPGVVVAMLVGFWSATLVAAPLLLIGRRGLADQIPFGPFLILGAIVALGWGDSLVRAYLSLIG